MAPSTPVNLDSIINHHISTHVAEEIGLLKRSSKLVIDYLHLFDSIYLYVQFTLWFYARIVKFKDIYQFNSMPEFECFKGTNGRQKAYEIFHVYCIFYSGFMCQTTVIIGITKDGSLVLNTLTSWNCFSCRNLFQNGANDMSECLTFETAFCKKAQNFV